MAASAMTYYFAYGSNMDATRMRARELRVSDAVSGRLSGFGLRFNKRSRHNPSWACANIVYARDEQVEGVLYQLADHGEIAKLDPYEGTPVYYSREYFLIEVAEGLRPAWTYVANPASIDNQLLPARWYLEHLLAGRTFLSDAYYARLAATPCREETDGRW